MDRHLSKAIRTDNKEWVTGFLIGRYDPTKIESEISGCWINDGLGMISTNYHVDTKTICKHTGHPNNLFEGDEVRSDYGAYGFVLWCEDECQYVVRMELFDQLDIPLFKNDDWKPTGRNIHDLPKEAAKHFDSIEVSQDVKNQVDKTIQRLEE